jgi:hypothetical protein
MSGQTITDYARTLCGSHYLLGSGGDCPGEGNGAAYRRRSVALAPAPARAEAPAVFAGQIGDKVKPCVCAGRFRKIPGGRYAYSTDDDYQRYMKTLQGTPESTWQPFFGRFSPRLVRGVELEYDGIDNNNRIVWGEDCRHVRHFDCISFINFVMSEKTSLQWSFDIVSLDKGLAPTTEVPLNGPPVAGDILLKGTHHIGFLCEDDYIVQAECHATGVHDDEQYKRVLKPDDSHKPDWTKRLRVLDRYL